MDEEKWLICVGETEKQIDGNTYHVRCKKPAIEESAYCNQHQYQGKLGFNSKLLNILVVIGLVTLFVLPHYYHDWVSGLTDAEKEEVWTDEALEEDGALSSYDRADAFFCNICCFLPLLFGVIQASMPTVSFVTEEEMEQEILQRRKEEEYNELSVSSSDISTMPNRGRERCSGCGRKLGVGIATRGVLATAMAPFSLGASFFWLFMPFKDGSGYCSICSDKK